MAGDRKAPEHRDIDQEQQKYDGHDDKRFSPRAIKCNDILSHPGQYQDVQEYPFRHGEEQFPGEWPLPENENYRSYGQHRSYA